MIVLVLFVLLFGRGKISALMSDVAKGIKSLKSGLADEADDGDHEAAKPKAIEHQTQAPKPRARAPRRQKSAKN